MYFIRMVICENDDELKLCKESGIICMHISELEQKKHELMKQLEDNGDKESKEQQ